MLSEKLFSKNAPEPKVTIFLRNIEDWKIVNDLYKNFFKSALPPARSIIAGIDINRNLDIEMEVIAFKS